MHMPSGRGIWEQIKSNCDTYAQSGMPAAGAASVAFRV